MRPSLHSLQLQQPLNQACVRAHHVPQRQIACNARRRSITCCCFDNVAKALLGTLVVSHAASQLIELLLRAPEVPVL
jgi:hypothetical protein